MRTARSTTNSQLDTARARWSEVIRKDIPRFQSYADTLEAIATAIEARDPNASIIKLLGKLPSRVQDAAIPMSMISYVLDNRKAYMKAMAPQKLQARLARVRRVLARHVTANAKVGYKVTVDGANGPEVREGEVSVPTVGSYRDFMKALVSAITTKEGEFELDDLDENPTPLRVYLEAKAPVRHAATGLFYDWIEDNYRWYRDSTIETLSKDGYGFAGTPFTWDYFKDDAALLDTYGDAFVDDDEMYDGEDESGKPVPKSDAEQAEYIWSVLENGSDTVHTRQNELESGDYFIIRWA